MILDAVVIYLAIYLTIYCRFNSICINYCCADNHHHNLFEIQLLYSIVNNTPEIAKCKETNVNNSVCNNGLMCYEVYCE
jgi:hypothetical protein